MLIPKTLFFHLEDKLRKFSRSGRKITSTLIMVLASLLPYTDIFVCWFIDLESIKLQRFANLQVAVWSLSSCISPLAVLYASKLRPWWPSYIVTIYVNITSFLGFLLLETSLVIESDVLFRFLAFLLSLLLLFLGKYFPEYVKTLILKDKISHELNIVKRSVNK